MSEDDENGVPDAEAGSDGASDDGSGDPLDALADELRRVVGMRSPKALRDAHLPHLSAVLDEPDDPDQRLQGIRRLITDGLGKIDDAQFGAAAAALFAFDGDRWTPLRQRGERASAPFNCSFDAFRRARRSTGVSLLDETVRQLARAIQRAAPPPTTRPVADADLDPSPADEAAAERPPDGERPDRRRRTPLVLVGTIVALLAVVAASIAVWSARGGSDSTDGAAAGPRPTRTTVTTVREEHCRHVVGATTDDALAAYRKPFVETVDRLTPSGAHPPCGESPIEQWDELTIQPLSLDGEPYDVLVATDPEHVMLLTRAEFNSYHQVGGKDGTLAQGIAGLPRTRSKSASGKVWLLLTDHGAMASEGVDQPGYYLGDVVWSGWEGDHEDSGPWGLPASNPLFNSHGYYQDFSKGRLTLSYGGDLVFHPVADPAASLPANIRGQILRHDDGTTWYIDRHDVRHWIPDGPTWECLHDRGSRELDHVPGYAIATLQLGDPASCAAD